MNESYAEALPPELVKVDLEKEPKVSLTDTESESDEIKDRVSPEMGGAQDYPTILTTEAQFVNDAIRESEIEPAVSESEIYQTEENENEKLLKPNEMSPGIKHTK